MAYSKLHSSIVHSSLWCEPDHIRLLFITLLAQADKDGVAYGSRLGLERLAMIKWDRDNDPDPWDALMSPDNDSSDKLRCPENEGRRLEEVPGGFRLLNFAYYRGLRNDDDRREQNRAAQERYRKKSAVVSHDKPPKAVIIQRKPPKAHTEAEAEAEEREPPKSPKGDAAVLLASWNQTPGVVKAMKLTGKRAKAAAARLADPDWHWREALAKFPLRCFDTPDGCKPDLDFFLRPDTVMKIIEGKYDWVKSNTQNGNQPVPPIAVPPVIPRRIPKANFTGDPYGKNSATGPSTSCDDAGSGCAG